MTMRVPALRRRHRRRPGVLPRVRAPASRRVPPRAGTGEPAPGDAAAARGGRRRHRRRRGRDRADAGHGDGDHDRHRHGRQRDRSPPPPCGSESALAEWPAGHDRLDEHPRSRFRRSTAATLPSRAQSRLAGRDCDVSACSIRRATRASIPGTGSSSPASIRASRRRRAACARPAAVQRGAHTERVSR